MSPYSTLEFDPVLKISHWFKRIYALVDLYCLSCSGTGLSLDAELPWPFLKLSFLLILFYSFVTCRKCESLLLGFYRVGCSYRLRNPQAWDKIIVALILILKRTIFLIEFGITHRLHARTAGCSTPPRRCRRCPAPAPPQDRATHAVTTSCVGFAAPWTPAIWGTWEFMECS